LQQCHKTLKNLDSFIFNIVVIESKLIICHKSFNMHQPDLYKQITTIVLQQCHKTLKNLDSFIFNIIVIESKLIICHKFFKMDQPDLYKQFNIFFSFLEKILIRGIIKELYWYMEVTYSTSFLVFF